MYLIHPPLQLPAIYLSGPYSVIVHCLTVTDTVKELQLDFEAANLFWESEDVCFAATILFLQLRTWKTILQRREKHVRALQTFVLSPWSSMSHVREEW